MGNIWNQETAQRLFEKLSQSYEIYGPKRFAGEGCYSDQDVIRYGKLNGFDEIVWDQKSDYSFKETIFPISDTMMYFTEQTTKLPEEKKRRIVFLRACECHALRRLDEIYLRNGAADSYYQAVRGKRKIHPDGGATILSLRVSVPAWGRISRGNTTDTPIRRRTGFTWSGRMQSCRKQRKHSPRSL